MQRELGTELPLTDPQPHPLAGLTLRVLAGWEGDDSVLVEHLDSELLSVVHLSWRMGQERPQHPNTEFTGSFGAFLIWSGISPSF